MGAVYLYDGATHALISQLTGSSENDNLGSDGVTALTNGNFVVRSRQMQTLVARYGMQDYIYK